MVRMSSSSVRDDYKSLLTCIRSDGTLDIAQALATLDDDGDEGQVEEPSLFPCITPEGRLDIANFLRQQDQISLLELSSLKEAGLIDNGSAPTHSNTDVRVRPFVQRNSRSMLFEVWDGDLRREATPFDSNWWKMYIEHPMLNIPKFHRCFRRRFRMPYDQFIQFVSDSQVNKWFPRWSKHNSKAPIELLILGGFRYLGRGWTFDDLEESTMISAEVHRNYFHSFIAVGANILYPLYVAAPTTMEECETHMHEFRLAGFNGAIGSTDATHIAIERCVYRLQNNHLGPKQHLTARTFNLTVNHRRRILSTTVGYPGRWNDKTVVLFDPFVRGIYEGLF